MGAAKLGAPSERIATAPGFSSTPPKVRAAFRQKRKTKAIEKLMSKASSNIPLPPSGATPNIRSTKST